ncbi:MAG: ABC transporter permease [Acidobacteria bacterium]|nr:ABC transporter permease [Acidobacteriota bacterium]
MTAAITIATHHLRRVVRNPGLILLLVAIPLTIALIEYAAFGQTAAAGKLPPTKVLFLDEDGSLASGAVPQVFAGSPVKDMFELAHVASRDEAIGLFKKSQAAALIVVPKGFQDNLLAGRRSELVLYKNPIQSIGPDIAQSMLEMTVVIGNGLYGQAIEPISRIKTYVDQRRDPTSDEVAEVSRGFFEAGRRMVSLQGLQNMKVGVIRPGEAAAKTGFGNDPKLFFAYVFPGLVVFALMFIAQSLAMRLLRDRMKGLQRRIAIAPASGLAVIFGGVIFMVVSMLALLLVLAALGAIVFRLQLRDPIALMAIGIGFAIFASGLHLLSNSLAKSDRGASFVGGVVVMLLSLVGGSFVPAEQFPPFLRSVAMIVPNGAAQQGFIDVLVHKLPIAQLGGRLAVTWAWGLTTVGLAMWFEGRRLKQ